MRLIINIGILLSKLDIFQLIQDIAVNKHYLVLVD